MSHYDKRDELIKNRGVQHDVLPAFKKRWSPRAYTGAEVPEEDLMKILEAGRLAPSCANSQPWRIIYAHRETPDWAPLFQLLVPANQSWVKNCGVLMLIVAEKVDKKGSILPKKSFDCGACWMSMALQGSEIGYPLHAMAGFDEKAAAEAFNLGDRYDPEVMIALGVAGNPENLSENQREREKPNERLKIDEIAIKANQANQRLA